MEKHSFSHGYSTNPAGGISCNRIESIGRSEVVLTTDYPNSSRLELKHVATKISLAILVPKCVKQVNDDTSHTVTVEKSDGAPKPYSESMIVVISSPSWAAAARAGRLPRDHVQSLQWTVCRPHQPQRRERIARSER